MTAIDLFDYAEGQARKQSGMAGVAEHSPELPSDLRRKLPTVTSERLRELFTYNPDTGLFVRNIDCGGCKAGAAAGTTSKVHGYVFISIDYQGYRAHRLAWFYMTGEWPPVGYEPDHVNGCRADNRFANLRLATRSQNTANARLMCTNTSGYRGVHFHKEVGRWCAMINATYLGLFDTPEEAHEAYCAAAKVIHGEFWRGGIIERAAKTRVVILKSELSEAPAEAWDAAIYGRVIQRTAISGTYLSLIFDPRSA